MTCKTGECGTVHNFGSRRASDGSYTCDCGFFKVTPEKALGRSQASRTLWHPSTEFLEPLMEEDMKAEYHNIPSVKGLK